MKTCNKSLCNECPFSNKSLPGWLGDYKVSDIETLFHSDALFPCHLTISKEADKLSQTQVQKLLKDGELTICRGYVEMIIKSFKLPKYNNLLKQLVFEVKKEGSSEDSMGIAEFRNHHTKIKSA